MKYLAVKFILAIELRTYDSSELKIVRINKMQSCITPNV